MSSEGSADEPEEMRTVAANLQDIGAPENEHPPQDNHTQTHQPTNSADARYSFDPEKLQTFRNEKPWTSDPLYFEKVAISPSAIMKMMMHCQSGVDKGIQKGGNPIEVMGMLLGRPDPDTPRTLVVTDAFPLPIEGFETRVIADDQDVVNHMISLGECLEVSRFEKFFGWYHSHPFDLGEHSHCFLSQTDLSTQIQWQRAEDPHGNPFVAIVIDPLRSLHTGNPEIKAFRAYPPEYNAAGTNQCPDGTSVYSEQKRLERWGSCWNRYYELRIEYYMSSGARIVMEQLTQDYLWARTLGGSGRDPDYDKELPDCIGKAAGQFKGLDSGGSKVIQIDSGHPGRAAAETSSVTGTSVAVAVAVAATSAKDEAEIMDSAVQDVVHIASEALRVSTLEQRKHHIFSKDST